MRKSIILDYHCINGVNNENVTFPFTGKLFFWVIYLILEEDMGLVF